ncbi:uncharacterized protein LOC114542487 [Dendronephthya gigantea]|uniref:uncharacterized protein LOC114542487 n=1 Tax=Dendronephthya gigantea TaxID=151771 RepID=UPI001069A69C|nr:uncharacterized protein LOC114542487 [Dendronephthya gigantea]
MFTDIQHWVRSCIDCQTLFSDYLTRWPEAFAVSTIEASVIAKLLVNEIFCRHGAPKTLLSDRGKNFLSKLIREVCGLLDIKKLNTTAYHPQTDGLVERFNSIISQSLSMYVSANQKDWDEFLPSILFAYRTSPQATTGDSPFYLLYGREPRLPIDVNILPPQTDKLSTSIAEHRARIVSQLEEAQRLAKANTERTQQQMKARYDLKSKPDTYRIGQRVWVFTPKTQKGLSKKLLHCWHGPYRIAEKVSPVNFKLRNLANRLIATPVHVNRMKLFYDANERPIEPPNDLVDDDFSMREDDIPLDSFETTSDTESHPDEETQEITLKTHASNVPNQPDHSNDDEIYQIEKVLKTRLRKGQKEYLVKWLGFPSEQNSWVTESDMVTQEQPSINSLTLTSNQQRNSKLAQRIFRSVYHLVAILILLVTCITIGSAHPINLGPLYDCSRVYHTALYKFTDYSHCEHDMHLSDSKVKYFEADVLQYSPRSSSLPIFHCTAQRLRMTCSESFFGHKSRHHTLHTISVSNRECIKAVIHHKTRYGKLKQHSHGEWRTHTPDSYSCKWLKTRTNTYIHFRVIQYLARLTGKDRYIQQHLTHTHCRYSRYYCRPREKPKSSIVWKKLRHHDTRLYHSLGKFTAHRIDNYILIPSLSISGTVVKTRETTIMVLDSGYVIINLAHRNSTLVQLENKLKSLKIKDVHLKIPGQGARRLARVFSIQVNLFVSHLAALSEQERINMIRAWENVCRQRQQMSRIYRWAIENFPHSSSRWFSSREGHTISPYGDAYLLSQCYNETAYTLILNRTYNGTCYSKFPVYLHTNKQIRYLSLTERRLNSHSKAIPCDNIPDATYIADHLGTLWYIDRNGTASKTNYTKTYLPAFSNAILKLGDINPRLLRYIPEPFETFSLLDVLAQTQETIEQLDNIRAADEGNNVALGIGKIIGITLSGISSGGSHIIKAVGSALHDGLTGLGNLDEKVITSLGKATGNVIDSSGRAFEHAARGAGGFFHDVLGGLSGSLLWGALVLLTVFCLYQYILKQRNCFQKSDTSADVDQTDINQGDVDVEINNDQYELQDMTMQNECVDCGLPRCPSVSNNLSQESSV